MPRSWAAGPLRWASALAFLATACATPPGAAVQPDSIGTMVAAIPVGPQPAAGLAVGAGAVWVPNDGEGSVSRINPWSNEVVATIRLGTRPACILCWGSVATD